MMFSLEESAGMRALMWVSQLYFLLFQSTRTLIVVLFIMVLLQVIVQLQLCFFTNVYLHICWHFVGEREAPE